jgi:predicted AlkP superfamily phosphohydrolase/phosphomutase
MVQTLFVGMDGATFTIIDNLTSDQPGQGVVMPCLKGLLERGFRAKLRSTPNPLTPPAWVALMTGRSPGNHGVYDFIRFEDRGNEIFLTLYDARDIRVETIWSLVSRAGRSVVSLNFPMMAPPPTINGSLIPGFVSWKHLRRNVTPESLYDRVSKIPGFSAKEIAWDFEREMQIGFDMPPDELEAWIKLHLPREDQWFTIAETLMVEDRPDFLAVLFDGVDKFQHQAWIYLDPALAPAQPDESYRRIRSLLLDYFRKLDGYVERLMTLAGPKAQLFIASDHGFTQSTEVIRINRYLGELGYLTWKEIGDSEIEKRREAAHFAYLDWSKTLAYSPTPSSNGICIRVAKKPGDPGIPPGEYHAFRERLIADLRALKCPATGEPIITEIKLREDVFAGQAMEQAPDITLVLRDFGFVSVRNRAPVVQPRPVAVGTHHPDGIFVAAGHGIDNADGGLMSILDVPAVMVHSLGLPVPADFEGRVPDELFTTEHMMRHPVRIGAPTQSLTEAGAIQNTEEMSEEAKEKMYEQLKALGYLED